MNRAVQKLHRRRCALKNNSYVGGGLAVNPEASFLSTNGVPYAENQHYSECYTQMRPGALEVQPNVELAQVAMPMPAQSGGYLMSATQLAALSGKRGGTRRRLRGGQSPACSLTADEINALAGGPSQTGGTRRQGCGLMRGGSMTAAQLASVSGRRGGFRVTRRECGCMRGGQRGGQRGGGCGCNRNFKFWGGHTRGRTRGHTGGQCGKPEVAWLGGKHKSTRKMLGGRFEMDVAQNIGGDGPIAEPVRAAIPCDARAGMQNPFTATPVNPDPRAPVNVYSLTPNTPISTAPQSGGSQEYLSERVPNFAYSSHLEKPMMEEYSQTMMGGGYGGNAYDASCYKAPGSEMPVYPATSAGFSFTPSTEGGANLPDGITAFNEVVARTARLGGAYRKHKRSTRRKTHRNKKAKKSKRSRSH